jgi:tRNA 5-methylaminomethyl-2-thiouridine biosynthesis bifunctional protein
MAQPLVPARPAYQEGTPYSETFGDVYHSAAGGLAQANHVFLKGNRLPERWAGRERFVILETGFGLGINFLTTWQTWRRDPRRCRSLHFVSVEKHPFYLQDLRTLHERYPQVQEEAAQLHSTWPILVPGGHRLVFEGGAVTLTLFFADIKVLRDLKLAADAIYLDGFSPAKNPEMWSPQTLRAVSRLAASGATVATWSVASAVRAALEETGFEVEKHPGFGFKKEMLCARLLRAGTEIISAKTKTATVVGAGLAGAAVCERLCARGWEVTLIEKHAGPAQEGSGNHAGAFHPIVTPDDSVFARLTRAAFLLSLSSWKRFPAARWDPCGALQLARNEKEQSSQNASIAALALPPEYAQLVTREEASAHAGVPVAAGGLWFPQAGWIQPQSLVQALLDACGSRLERIFHEEMRAEDLKKIAEDRIMVLATADDALHRIPHARLRRVRGQLTYLPEKSFEAPHVVVLRGGMVLPPVDGMCVVGASFDIDDDDPEPRAQSDAGNLERLERILSIEVPGDEFKNRVAFRSVARDRLPVAGRIDVNVYGALALGSRGLIWSTLAAEAIAAELEGEPAPLEKSLLQAIDPARFARRAAIATCAGSRDSRP